LGKKGSHSPVQRFEKYELNKPLDIKCDHILPGNAWLGPPCEPRPPTARGHAAMSPS
jgi:hypothetical protein